MSKKLMYTHYKIPTTYIGVDYSDLDVTKSKAAHLKSKMSKAPPRGLLCIKGNAAPIVNQLFDSGRIVRGVDFVTYSDDAFGTHEYPHAEVILLYNIGSEVSTNYQVSRQVLQKFLKYYKSQNTLVVLETHFTKAEMLHNYDVRPSNFIVMDDKPDEVWI